LAYQTRILAIRAKNTTINKILCLDRLISIRKIDDASNKHDTTSLISGIRHSGSLSSCHLFIIAIMYKTYQGTRTRPKTSTRIFREFHFLFREFVISYLDSLACGFRDRNHSWMIDLRSTF